MNASAERRLPQWIVPDWPAPAGVRAVFTTRGTGSAGAGHSVQPWDRFNLGDHVGDDPIAVQRNRTMLSHAIDAHPVFLDQIHGTGVVTLSSSTSNGAKADGAVSTETGLACTMMVADCLPVLFTDVSGAVVGAAHAGWRGLAAGVLERTLTQMQTLVAPADQADPERRDLQSIMAWLGPCIGPRAFEVGSEVREAFVDRHPEADTFFDALGGGKYLADLSGLARLRLRASGLTAIYGNDGSSEWCTVARPDLYFSYRRDQRKLGGSGRMAACIWRATE